MDLSDLLDLDEAGPDRFTAHSPREERARVFGGQVVAQALVAAGRTAPDDHHVHSLHAYFLRGGGVGEPIDLQVDRLRDGRSFTARRVTAAQRGEPILVLSTSFHTGGDGGDYLQPAPVGVPGPDGLPETHFARHGRVDARDASFDQPVGTSRRVWFRSAAGLPDEPLVHAAALAYATDHGLFGAARRVVDAAGGRFDELFRASLDHAIWFHGPVRFDTWHLYDVDALAHRHDRVLTAGRVYDTDLRQVATVTQEILARPA